MKEEKESKNTNEEKSLLSRFLALFSKSKDDVTKDLPNNANTKIVNKDPKAKKTKKSFFKSWKLPTSLTILFVLLIVVIILTWVVPHAPYVVTGDEPSYIDPAWIPENGKYGLLDAGIAIYVGFFEAIPLILYLFVLGAFIEIMMETGTMSNALGATLNKGKGKEIYLIPILFTIFSLFGSAWGMQEETIAYYAILVPFLYLAGFNSMTAILTMMLGATTGIAASTVNPFTIGVSIDAIADVFGDSVTTGTLLGARFMIWVALTAVGATFVTVYAKRAKKKEKLKSDEEKKYIEESLKNKYAFSEESIEKMSRRQMISIIAFFLTFLIMILGILPWGELINSAAWEDYLLWRASWINDVWWLSSLLAPIGSWGFVELSIIFMLGLFAQMIIHAKGQHKMSHIVFDGVKGMAVVGFLLGIARSITIVLQYSGLQSALVMSLSDLIGGTNPFVFLILIFVIFIIIGAIIPSTSGAAAVMMPTLAGVVLASFGSSAIPGDPATIVTPESIQMMGATIICYSLALGLMNMFIPTQAVVLASTEASGVDYLEFLKPTLAYVGILSIMVIGVIIPILTIGVM